MINTTILQRKNMQKYIIGIDTGGTYTDAVLFDTESTEIICTAKYPTSHYDLSQGIGKSVETLLQKSRINPDQIVSIGVSSTLATNSVVENKGARVAVIVIGYVKHFKLPVKAVLFVKGGHTIQGKEEEPLDIEYLVELVTSLRSEVDAYGICSAMSMKNPTHELVVEKAIGMLDPKPVFCSHQISQQTGMQERAATAGLHAKLMPVMEDFVAGVTKATIAQNLNCPVMVIGGNGTALKTTKAIKEAGLTVASGPACTAHFGALQNKPECLVIDIGGTTTDIAMIEGGSPLLTADGCQIGQWKTHVEAVDMLTGGVGGDSHVNLDSSGKLSIGPSRVVPVAMGREILPIEEWLGVADDSRLICLYPDCKNKLPVNEVATLLTTSNQLTPAKIRKETGLGGIPLDIQLEKLSRNQQIFECGFTPTDALHVLGKIDIGDQSQSVAAAKLLGKQIGLGAEEFAELILLRTEELIENMIIDYVTQHYWDNSLTHFISTRKSHPVVGVDFSIKLPLIGIGAAARYLLPRVAERLQTSVSFPQYCEVGNAIGAAIICNENLNDKPQ